MIVASAQRHARNCRNGAIATVRAMVRHVVRRAPCAVRAISMHGQPSFSGLIFVQHSELCTLSSEFDLLSVR